MRSSSPAVPPARRGISPAASSTPRPDPNGCSAFPPPRFRGIMGHAAPDHGAPPPKERLSTMAAHDALRTILPAAGLAPERAASVEITGGSDPVLPTPFRLGETSAAALAATGLAAADLWQLRSGRRQQVAVDLRQATASLRSGH